MNTTNSEMIADPGKAEQETKPESEQKPRRGGSGLAFFALLLALAALVATAWLWWQGETERAGTDRLATELMRLESGNEQLAAKLKRLTEEVESMSTGVGDSQLEELQVRLSEDREALEAVRQTVQEQAAISRSLQVAGDSLHTRLLAAEAALAQASARELDARGELDLAEVDYLLRLASERLQLFSDGAGAERALALADAHLAALGNPSYLAVRQAIAASRRELDAVEQPDDVEVAARLDSIQRGIPDLVLRGTAAAAETAATDEPADWWGKLKQTFASLVTVRRSTEEENLRISLQDEAYIRQSLWLQVEFARLALMRRDQAAFDLALERASGELAEWFESASPAVASLESQLAELAALDLEVEWPDISGPWTLLRQVSLAPSDAQAASTEEATPAGELPDEGTPIEEAGELR